MIRIAICDDEPIFIEQIKSMLKSTLSKAHISYLTDSFTSGESLCEKLKGGFFYDYGISGYLYEWHEWNRSGN